MNSILNDFDFDEFGMILISKLYESFNFPLTDEDKLSDLHPSLAELLTRSTGFPRIACNLHKVSPLTHGFRHSAKNKNKEKQHCLESKFQTFT